MIAINNGRSSGTHVQRYMVHDPLDPPLNTDEALVCAHKQYISAVTSRTILLGRKHSYHTAEGGSGDERSPEYKAIPYVVRGTDAYTCRSQARVYRLMDRYRSLRLPPGMFITISPRGGRQPLYEQMCQVKALWPKFCNALRMHTIRWDTRDGHRLRPRERCPKEYVRREYPFRGAYLWAWEPHPGDGPARHYPHYHLHLARMIADKEGLAQWALSWWQDHGVDIAGPGVLVEYTRSRDDVARYAIKYVTKGCNDPLWSAIQWLTRWRVWGASRVLGKLPINSHPTDPANPEWELIGIVPTDMIEWILQDRPPPEDIQSLCDAWIKRKT
jgi:hypothetical protein